MIFLVNLDNYFIVVCIDFYEDLIFTRYVPFQDSDAGSADPIDGHGATTGLSVRQDRDPDSYPSTTSGRPQRKWLVGSGRAGHFQPRLVVTDYKIGSQLVVINWLTTD